MIFETLDIMEGVDGMLELDFIVVDGTSAKDLHTYETQCGKTSKSLSPKKYFVKLTFWQSF